ncbi:MAG TPA: hypothetical protein VGF59_06350 [Bryobacteraceae bacterium]
MATLTRNAEAIASLESQVQVAAERRQTLRDAVRQHKGAAHPQADATAI